ncbi:twin-arginine translocase subunit TatC [Aquipuribacter nitratireducens]|uniref:Sec-independent protein translocase protein TatC n=1 Tax=Aquipuribacter nitratireducens TaxID=650104 RepID=A0ABW0GJ60_9MICO
MLRRARNPEGRMPLRAHLVELRNRLVVAGIAVVAMGVVGWVVYPTLVEELVRPIVVAAEANDQPIDLRFASPTEAFDVRVKMSLWIGVIGSSPVWIYQLWAFITPGLTRKERWYSVGFLAASVPLFLAGVTLAWFVLPNAFIFLTSLNPEQVGSFFDFSLYVAFVTRVALFFGVAFLLPVVLVALNLAGLVEGRTLLRGWRFAVVVTLVFAAIASPTPDIWVMFTLTGPMLALYLLAVGIASVVDWRRARRSGTRGLDDEEASAIEDADGVEAATGLGEAPGIEHASALDDPPPLGAADGRGGDVHRADAT